MWAGLDFPGWRALHEALRATPEDAVDALVAMVLALRQEDAHELARRVRLPHDEVVASPFGLRACAMGAETGARHVHRELTRVPAFAGDERTHDPMHDAWADGVLKTGKYQGFIQDGAHSLFDPSHIAKWGPHELLHRACSFFWRADASDFELYVGARANEMLPVTFWYGADQFLRLDEHDFVRHESGHVLDAAAWRSLDVDSVRERVRHAVPLIERGFEHAARELELMHEEMRTGRVMPRRYQVGGAVLDPSSDALAYVVAHRKRLRDADIAAVLEQQAHHDDIASYLAFIETCMDRLFCAPLADDEGSSETRDRWHNELSAAIAASGGDASHYAEADGVRGLDLAQLALGLEATVPHAFEWLEEHESDDDEGWLSSFVESDAFWQRAPLAKRLEIFARDILRDARAADLAAFDGCVLALAKANDVLAPSEVGSRLVPSSRFTAIDFTTNPFADTDEPSSWLIGVRLGESGAHEVELLERGPELDAFWREHERPIEEREARALLGDLLDALLELGALERIADF